jgi:hypothetical protein
LNANQHTYRFRVKKYAISTYINTWENDGHEVNILFGTEKYVPADICIIHVDLSVVPENYLEFAKRYPRVINSTVENIQKTSISKNIVTAQDDYCGSVIVKSNNNYGGWPELLLTRNIPLMLRKKFWAKVRKSPACISSSSEYTVFESKNDVPLAIFSNPELIVEKFKPEKINGLFYTNVYVFLGESHLFFREAATDPIVKFNSIVTSEITAADTAVIDVRRSLGIDYGKIDYCYHQGELVIFDVNKTPGVGATKYKDIYTMRARALYEYL